MHVGTHDEGGVLEAGMGRKRRKRDNDTEAATYNGEKGHNGAGD